MDEASANGEDCAPGTTLEYKLDEFMFLKNVGSSMAKIMEAVRFNKAAPTGRGTCEWRQGERPTFLRKGLGKRQTK